MPKQGETFRYFPRIAEVADTMAEGLRKRPLQLRVAFWLLTKEIEQPFYIVEAVYGVQRPRLELLPELEEFCTDKLLSKPREDLEKYYQREDSPGWQEFILVRKTLE